MLVKGATGWHNHHAGMIKKPARFWDNITLISNPQYTKLDLVRFKLLDFRLALKLNRFIESSTLVTSIMYQSDVKV